MGNQITHHITENIFTYEYAAKIMPGVSFPVRSSFLILDNNQLLLISPGPFETDMIQNIISKYDKVYCVAPNLFHHMHLKAFKGLFPNIEIYGPTNLVKKQSWLSGQLSNLDLLQKKLQGQVSFFPILGNPSLDETVFYCHRSKSLIITDLIFNMKDPMPLGRGLLLGLMGAKNKISQSKLLKYTMKSKSAYTQSVEPLSELECQRIILGHGQIIEGNSEIKKAFEVISNH